MGSSTDSDGQRRRASSSAAPRDRGRVGDGNLVILGWVSGQSAADRAQLSFAFLDDTNDESSAA